MEGPYWGAGRESGLEGVRPAGSLATPGCSVARSLQPEVSEELRTPALRGQAEVGLLSLNGSLSFAFKSLPETGWVLFHVGQAVKEKLISDLPFCFRVSLVQRNTTIAELYWKSSLQKR